MYDGLLPSDTFHVLVAKSHLQLLARQILGVGEGLQI